MSEAVQAEHLEVIRAGIDTYTEPVVYMREDCAVCRSEGFEAQARVVVQIGTRSVIATLNVVSGEWLPKHAAALSESAWKRLDPQPGDVASFQHPDATDSMRHVRTKVYGGRLGRAEYVDVMREALAGRLSEIEIAAFLTACAARPLDIDETIALTRAMIDVGSRLHWTHQTVLDKHCIGGLPGNRTTPIVVAIVAACGYTIPKTSSRAITSPAGTADTMATLAPVDLDIDAMRRVVDREGGCIVWGGSVGLSPADDVLIRVERPLDFDSDSQLVASVLSKKIAAGSTHVLLDLPVGPTAKLRSQNAARALGERLIAVGEALGIKIALHVSEGAQPVGRGIGPALEARDVLAVLRRTSDAPADLRDRALDLAGSLLELGGDVKGTGRTRAAEALDSGRAERKFEAICSAQGGRRQPAMAPHRAPITATTEGIVRAVDNRMLARVAKLAGAPRDPAAGVDLHVRLGETVTRGMPLMTVHADAPGEIGYAVEYYKQHTRIFRIEAP